MAYNKKNTLRRMVEVQNITLEYTSKGSTQEWVYENVIHPRFFISRSTYYSYLGMPAKAELRKLLQEEKKQLCLAM
jgi:hypothetical protein